jgi:hypothetical protein
MRTNIQEGFFGMNISEPLWNVPRNDSASSPNDTASLNTSKILGNAHSNRNLSKQVNETWPNNPSTELDIFKSEFDAVITAITTSGPHLFTFRAFLIVAFIATINMIALPLLADAIIRTALQSLDRYKGSWRILILVLGIETIITVRVFVGIFIYIIIFAVPQGLLAIWKLYTAQKILTGVQSMDCICCYIIPCLLRLIFLLKEIFLGSREFFRLSISSFWDSSATLKSSYEIAFHN